MSLSLVVLGAGDLGQRVAALRAGLQDEVWALRRRKLPMPAGIHARQGDMQDPETLRMLPANPDVLLFCPTPDERSEPCYRRTYLDALRTALQTLQPKRVLFVSSTAVYAQDDGQWVDEDSPAEADSFNGRVLREAEQLCLSRPESSVLRLSGITGPGRHMLVNRALLGVGIHNTWTNRIHLDDAASAISHLMDRSGLDPVYNVSDDEPALQIDVANWIRERHHLPALPAPQTQATGKKVCNARLKATGWRPAYPSYRQSYPQGGSAPVGT
jgi:electron-transferring-flavoprotein dehydrogenase